MKKTHLIIAGLLITALLSCSSSDKKSGSSLVTITVGSNQSASISIRQATLFARLKNFLADHFQVRSAMALIPTNVASIQITIWASDMPIITRTIDTPGLASVSVTIEVPNGLNRQFTVRGFDTVGATGNITYWGDIFADLSGDSVTLPIPMINLGSVTNIIYVSTSGNDLTGNGTEKKPYRTITNALRVSANGNQAIFVGPGTYDANSNNPNPETFPLQLNLGTALVCRGANHSTVIDSNNSSDVIYGNVAASVQFCTVRVCDATGINDTIGGGSPTPILINNVLLDDREEAQPGCGALDAIILGANSTVADSTIANPLNSGITINTGNPVVKNNTLTGNISSFYGINVVGGSPLITNSTINGFFGDGAGLAISLGTGTATVSQCSMSGNGNGISISGGSPTITGNTIRSNSNEGIFLSLSLAGVPPTATISGNTIGHNSYGIYGSAVGTSSIHDNKIFCNSAVDFYLLDSSASSFDISNNAWDHDTMTLVSGPTITNNFSGCPPGEDICYTYLLTTAPIYTPFKAAVPGGCQ